MEYKRNQLEEAIAGVIEPTVKRRPSQGLRIKIKRILEADRALKSSKRSDGPTAPRYAFFSGGPPGRGVEVWFSEYEVFAVCLSLQLLSHGWTPEVAAKVMRAARVELEPEHRRILRICDEGRAQELGFDNSPYLVAATGLKTDGSEEALDCCVRDSHRKAAEWTWQHVGRGQGFAMFYFAHFVQQIHIALEKSEPRRRGQPG